MAVRKNNKCSDDVVMDEEVGSVLCGKSHIATIARQRMGGLCKTKSENKHRVLPVTQCDITSTRRWVNNAFS